MYLNIYLSGVFLSIILSYILYRISRYRDRDIAVFGILPLSWAAVVILSYMIYDVIERYKIEDIELGDIFPKIKFDK
jgi:hypothetical protein